MDRNYKNMGLRYKNGSGVDEDSYTGSNKRSMMVEPDSENIKNVTGSVINSPPLKAREVCKMPDLVKKLKAALKGKTFVVIDKHYNSKVISYEDDPLKFLEDKVLRTISHDSDEQSLLEARILEWRILIDSLEREFCCIVFDEMDFSRTYVCASIAESVSILSKISEFSVQNPCYIEISPHMREFVRHNEKYSDLIIEKTDRDQFMISNIKTARFAQLKDEMRGAICQSYLLDEDQYQLLRETRGSILSHVEKFQIEGIVYSADIPLAVEVNPLSSISCIMRDNPKNVPVDNLLILSKQKPSQEFKLVYDRVNYKVWEALPLDTPTNQVVYAEILVTFAEDKLNQLFEDCLKLIYLGPFPVTTLGIKPCSQSTLNWAKVISCVASIVEHFKEEEVKMPNHYIMLIAENKEILAKIQNILRKKNTHAEGGQKELNIVVIEGDLTEQKVDAIVNSTNLLLELDNGATSKALLKKAGPDIQKECKRAYPNGISHPQVAMTRGYGLPCKYVIHGSVVDRNNFAGIPKVVFECLVKAHKYSSIAFPVLGTGNLKLPPDIAVKQMDEGFKAFSRAYPNHNIKEVRIVVFPGQPNIKSCLSKYFTTSAEIPLGPSFNPLEKWLKCCQQKLLHWVLFINYSGKPKNLELGLENFQKNLEKVPFMIDSEELDALIFFTDVFKLIPDIILQYSKKEKGEIQVFVPKKNLQMLQKSQKNMRDNFTHASFQIDIKLNEMQVKILKQKIQQKYPTLRCQVNYGQIFHFQSLDKKIIQKAKDVLKSLLGPDGNVSIFTEHFNGNNPEAERMESGPGASLGPNETNSLAQNSMKNEDTFCCQITDNFLVKVYLGSILEVNVDGIVNYVDHRLAYIDDVQGLLVQAVGEDVHREWQAKLESRELNDGDVLSTSAGNLKHCKNIIHAVWPKYTQPNLEKITFTIYNALREAAQLNFRSVAFPMISSVPGVPFFDYLKVLLSGIEHFCKEKEANCQLKEVYFVDHNQDKCKAIKDFFLSIKISAENIQRTRENSQNPSNQRKPEEPMDVDPAGNQVVHCFACKNTVNVWEAHKKCLNTFCARCFEKPCSLCHKPGDILPGSHPGGIMIYEEKTSIYRIQYKIPKAGKVKGFEEYAYLPGTDEGKIILKMLQLAFENYLIFKVDSGQITWSDIPHKITLAGEKNGYSDPEYLKKVKDCLATKGITPEVVAKNKLKKKILLK